MAPICRLCSSKALSPVIDLGRMPIAHRMLDRADQAEDLFPFALHRCQDCGLIQVVEAIDPAILYRDFNFNFSSWKAEPHMADELATIVAEGPPRSVFEIGCNDGRFLQELRERGVETCFGVEPNTVSSAMALEKGFNVTTAMIDEDLCRSIVTTRGAFDLVVSRQVIEHIPDLEKYFRCIDILLKPDGRLFLDCPDAGEGFRQGDVSILWEEHVNYFTRPVFMAMLARFGFEPVSVKTYDFSGGCLAVLSKRGPVQPLQIVGGDFSAGYADRVEQYRSRMRKALISLKKNGYTVTLYGVGCRACTAVNGLGIGDVIHLALDDQKERQGHFVPGARLPVQSPESLDLAAERLVCLLAVNNESEAKVKERLESVFGLGVATASLCSPRDILADLADLEAVAAR